MMAKCIAFCCMPFWKKWLCLKILFFLIIAKLVVCFLPFRRYARWLGKRQAETLKESCIKSLRQRQYLAFIRKFIPIFSRRLPWRSVCLHEALAAYFLIRQIKLPTTFYFGMNRKGGQGLGAHAWIRCGEWYITGGNGVDQTVVGVYAKYD